MGFTPIATTEGLEEGGWHRYISLLERLLWLQSGKWTGGPTRSREGDQRGNLQAKNTHLEKGTVRKPTAAWHDGAAAGRGDLCQAALAPDLCPPHLRSHSNLQGTPHGSASRLPPPRELPLLTQEQGEGSQWLPGLLKGWGRG